MVHYAVRSKTKSKQLRIYENMRIEHLGIFAEPVTDYF